MEDVEAGAEKSDVSGKISKCKWGRKNAVCVHQYGLVGNIVSVDEKF